MKKVVLRAPLLSKSGYGEHSRQVFKYLLTKPNLEIITQIVPWGITPWGVADTSFGGLAPEIMKRSASAPGDVFDVSIQIQLPNEWDASLAKFNIGITAGVETDKCNPIWTSVHCSKMDMVIVPSEHTKNTLATSASTGTPIHVVPESYFSELTKEPKDIDLDMNTSFNFLTVGVLTGMSPETDRKNLFYLIKWFVESFANDKSVGLIVKTNQGRETSIDRVKTKRMLTHVLKELGSPTNPKIYLLHGDMSRSEMNNLYKSKKVKALLSITRGEGFGLPLLEAAVAGLPVIATNWSAHTEFLNNGRWLKVDYRLGAVNKERIDNEIFVPGAQWAEADEESFKKTIKKFRKSYTTPTLWAQDLSKELKEKYSERSIFKKYEEVLGEILA